MSTSNGTSGWTKIDNGVIALLPEIRLAPFSVYVVIAKHADSAGVAWPSVPTIARLTGTTIRTARRAIATLQVRGLIRVERRKDALGRDQSSRYILSPVGESDTKTPPGVLSCPGEGDKNDPGEGDTRAPRTIPNKDQDPIKNKTHSSCRALRFDAADHATAEWMFALIQAMAPGHKKPNLDQWANEIRLMRERDHRTDEEIHKVFAWANQDDFWYTNILSPSKLREKYDQLTIKMKNGGKHARKNGFPCGPGQRHQAATGKVVVF